MFVACVYVFVCVPCMYIYLLLRVCMCTMRARACDLHGMIMDPYVARLFFSTNKRRGEKDREESRDIVNQNTYYLLYLCVTHIEINKFVDKKIFILPIFGTLK